jgi:hypothetical protein
MIFQQTMFDDTSMYYFSIMQTDDPQTVVVSPGLSTISPYQPRSWLPTWWFFKSSPRSYVTRGQGPMVGLQDDLKPHSLTLPGTRKKW